MELFHDLVDQYREFAAQAAYSPCFSSWATAVAEDPDVLRWLESLPRIKQQPNLVFAAARWHGVAAPGPYTALRQALLDDGAMSWLEVLVWPEHDGRRHRRRAAVEVARRDPPTVLPGDLLDDLPRLVAEAGRHGPVVVFHSAVIAYLDDDGRERFDTMIRDLVAAGACHWISNESATVLPSVTGTGPVVPPGHQTFVLGVDGRAVAWTHGHGRSMRWHPPTD